MKSKYEENFPERAEAYLQEGHTELELAKHLGISKASLENYKNKHLDFLDALKRGKISTDDEVENALLKRAMGFTVKVNGKDVHYPPDVTAQIFWLKNRRPKDWRDVKNINLNDQRIKATITDD